MPTPMPTPEASISPIVASPGRSPLGTPEPSDQGSPELTPRDVQPAQPQQSTPTGLTLHHFSTISPAQIMANYSILSTLHDG